MKIQAENKQNTPERKVFKIYTGEVSKQEMANILNKLKNEMRQRVAGDIK